MPAKKKVEEEVQEEVIQEKPVGPPPRIPVLLYVEELKPDPTPYKMYGATFKPERLAVVVDLPPQYVESGRVDPLSDTVVINGQGLLYMYNLLGFVCQEASNNQEKFNRMMKGIE